MRSANTSPNSLKRWCFLPAGLSHESVSAGEAALLSFCFSGSSCVSVPRAVPAPSESPSLSSFSTDFSSYTAQEGFGRTGSTWAGCGATRLAFAFFPAPILSRSKNFIVGSRGPLPLGFFLIFEDTTELLRSKLLGAGSTLRDLFRSRSLSIVASKDPKVDFYRRSFVSYAALSALSLKKGARDASGDVRLARS